ncbi:MAG: AraC family transcriptional regulator [Polyangiaceae bacterium]
MRRPREHEGLRQLVVRRPRPGILLARSSGGPLVRAVPERFGTTLHLAGSSDWASGRARWSSVAGTMCVKVPGEVAVEKARVGFTESQVVLFDAALVDEARATLDRPVLVPRHRMIDGRDERGLPLAELHRHVLTGDDEGLDEAVCSALVALVDLTCEARGTRSFTFGAAVARSRALLDERLTETVTLSELAAHARLDKFHLCRAFRDEVGLPPHAYVTHRRVARAQSLLARGVTATSSASLV